METKQKIEIGSSTIFRTILILLGLWFLFLIRDIIILLIGAFVIASAIEPIARKLRQFRVPRAMSVVIVYLVALFILSLSVVLIAPALAEQTAQLAQAVPQVWEGLRGRLGLDALVSTEQIVPSLQQSLGRIANDLANVSLNVFEQTRTFFSGLFSLVFLLIIAFYLVIEENALKKAFRLIIPGAHMLYVETMIDRVQVKLGRWVLAQLSLALIIFVIVTTGLWLLGVPHAVALGLIAGVLEIIPVIGPIIAGIIATVVALSQSFLLGIGVAIFFVVVQQLENHLLIPSIMRKATGLNPLVTLIAVLVGAQVAGTVGVILSIPVATILSILLSDFFRTAQNPDELAG